MPWLTSPTNPLRAITKLSKHAQPSSLAMRRRGRKQLLNFATCANSSMPESRQS